MASNTAKPLWAAPSKDKIMNVDEFETHVREMSFKSASDFTLLTFTSLALSYQFSHELGEKLSWMLVLSWILFVLAGLVGGWIIQKTPVFYQHNIRNLRASSLITELMKVEATPNFRAENVTDPTTGTRWNAQGWTDHIASQRAIVARTTELMEELRDEFPKKTKLQVVLFVSGLIANGIFATVNVLCR